MTNPNCEYGANFIAIHTLAQWSKCTVDGTLPTFGSDAVSCKFQIQIVIFVMNFAKCDYDLYFLADIKLESETEETTDFSDITLPPNVYHPKHALITALKVITVIFSIKYISTFEFSL